MPIEYEIDKERRLVTARAKGTVAHDDFIAYQLGVWSRDDVAGFDELVDMTQAEAIVVASMDAIPRLANLSARMDAPSSSRLAIVASDDNAFGLGRMYETYRTLDSRSTKEVGVFRTMPEALAFLRRDGTEKA